MMLGTLFYLVLLSLFYCCNSYKILLVFPIPSRSHAILGEGYVKHLAKAGHEITYITPLPMKNPPPGVRQIDVSENAKLMPTDVYFDIKLLINKQIDLQDLSFAFKFFTIFANETLHVDEVQNILHDPNEEFDAVIVEWLYTEVFSGLSAVFNCPLIWSSSVELHSILLELIDEYPNPSYTFDHLSLNYGFNFWQRLYELWTIVKVSWFKWRSLGFENQVYKDMYENVVKKKGKLLPSYEDIRYNGSLMLGNSHVATGEAISIPQNYKPVGGYHIDNDREPLPKDLQKIMDDSKHGVIYFSMGSVLRSNQIPETLKQDILNVFAALNQTVIWKLEEKSIDLPKNVHILPWAPQTSILAHPNCLLFITHGGHLSQTETLHFGVPMIGIPLYGDQFLNINRAVSKGYARKVDLYQDGARKLNLAIREMLGNSSYREHARKYSFIHKHRPVPPEKELVHWVEHVIKTRGAMYLRSPAIRVSWYQKYYLDLAAVILLLNVMVISLYKQALLIWRRHLKEKEV